MLEYSILEFWILCRIIIIHYINLTFLKQALNACQINTLMDLGSFARLSTTPSHCITTDGDLSFARSSIPLTGSFMRACKPDRHRSTCRHASRGGFMEPCTGQQNNNSIHKLWWCHESRTTPFNNLVGDCFQVPMPVPTLGFSVVHTGGVLPMWSPFIYLQIIPDQPSN